MSAELTALEVLAADYTGGLYRISPISLAVLFYATKYWKARPNWLSDDPLDSVTDSDWDTLESYVDGLLYEAKNPMIGIIMPYVTAVIPTSMLPCDGSTYDRVDYPELYAALDAVFIIDADSFSVPDLRDRFPLGASATVLPAAVGGEADHTLTVAEMPSHSHTDIGHSHSIGFTTTTLVLAPGEVPALIPVPLVPAFTGTSYASLTSTGGDTGHNNMPPYVALNYGIVAR